MKISGGKLAGHLHSFGNEISSSPHRNFGSISFPRRAPSTSRLAATLSSEIPLSFVSQLRADDFYLSGIDSSRLASLMIDYPTVDRPRMHSRSLFSRPKFRREKSPRIRLPFAAIETSQKRRKRRKKKHEMKRKSLKISISKRII